VSNTGNYFLAYNAIGKPFRLPISERRFEALSQAWSNLKHFAHVEEEWDAVVRNYVELEKTLLEAALRDMVVSDKDYFSFQEARLQFSVRLSNLLASCRAYLDHTPHHLGLIMPPHPYGAQFKDLTHAEYDGRFGYRFMEELRDYAQHRGLPIHSTQYSSAWVEGGERGMLSHSVSTHITLDILRKDKKFKRSIINDMTDERLHSEPLVRDYLEGLSAVHVALRKLIDPPFKEASETVRSALAEFATASPTDDLIGLHAIQLNPPRTWVRQVPLFEELIQVTEKLRRKNRPMVNLSRRFVTSSTEPNRKMTF
jgi:hypothetical protein